MKDVKYIRGVKNIVDNYEVFILDQWGVMHDGKVGYSHAIDCVDYIKSKNKKLIIISNSSKRKKDSLNRLPSLGFSTSFFEEIMTSGEMVWHAIALSLEKYGKNLKRCFYMFDDSDDDALIYLEGLNDIDIVKDISDADFI